MKTKAEIWVCKNLGCNKQFKHIQSLQNHKLNCGVSSSVKCPVCFKSLARSWYLKNHKCKQKESLECSQCSKVFPKVWHLKRHIKNVHAKLKKELKCSTCERRSQDKTSMTNTNVVVVEIRTIMKILRRSKSTF
eukprot:TCONS_00044747-protein